MRLGTQSSSSLLIKICYDKWPSETAVHQHSTEWLFWKALRVICHFSKLKPLRMSRKWWCPFSILKSFRSRKKVMQSFFGIKTSRQWWSSFSVLKKSRKTVMKFFFSFRSFTSLKKVTNSFFSYRTSNGFTYIMSAATVLSFPSYSCSEHFRIYLWKSWYVSNDCLWKLYL